MICGTLEHSGAFPRTTVWTVPDFFQLPPHVGFACYSKEYDFMDLKLRLATQPHGSDSLPNIMIVALCGLMKDSATRWELEVRRANDTILRRTTGFKADGDEMGTSMYIPVKDVEKGCSELGYMKIICRMYNVNATTFYAEENVNEKNVQTDEMICADKLSCDMEELMLREDYCDVKMKVGEREYPAHKAVFAVRSPVFMSMFRHKMSENLTGIVEINDCDAVVFREFMRYLYATRVSKYSPKVLFPLYQIADKYQVCDLKTYCVERVKEYMSVDNFCDSAKLCFEYNEDRFTNIVVQFLAENMSEVKKSEQWKSFDSENPEEADQLMQKALKYQEIVRRHKDNIFQRFARIMGGGKK